MIRNEILPHSLADSPIMKYFALPDRYMTYKFLDYTEKLNLVRTLPASYQTQGHRNPHHYSGKPINYDIERGESTDAVEMIRFVTPGNSEMFVLRLMFLETPNNTFRDVKRWESRDYAQIETLLYPGDRDASVSMGLF